MIEITIRFDGDFPGLAEKRLSIDTFGEPLSQLLVAVRRIATSIVIEAVEESERGAGGGRIARRAEMLDLQIEHIDGGSPLRLSVVLAMAVAAGSQGTLFDGLPERTGRVLMEALRDESAGRQRNARVRKYLEALPAGVTSQSYALMRDGQQVDKVSIGTVVLAEVPVEAPYVISAVGHVVAVGFEPGKSEVRIKTADGATIICAATAAQVDSAIALRASGPVEIKGVVTSTKVARLIAIRSESEPAKALTDDDMEGLIFEKWSALLKRLA